MSKKLEAVESNTVTVPTQLRPAAVVGVHTSNIQLEQSQLPTEFQGIKLDVIETGFAPTVKWNVPGDYVAGVYVKMVEDAGPNKSCLYTLEAKGKVFAVWGTTVLDRAMKHALESGQIKPGYLVMFTYIANVPSAYGDSPTKLFHIQVAKKS